MKNALKTTSLGVASVLLLISLNIAALASESAVQSYPTVQTGSSVPAGVTQQGRSAREPLMQQGRSAGEPVEISITRADSSSSSPGYIALDIDTEEAFSFQDDLFLPGDCVGADILLNNLSDRTASFGIRTQNFGNERYFSAVRILIYGDQGNSGRLTLYDGTLDRLNIPMLLFIDSGGSASLRAELYIPVSCGNDQIQGEFSAKLLITGKMEDFRIISYKDETTGSVGCYQSLHDGYYYYCAKDKPALANQNVPRGFAPDYGDDLRVFIGNDRTPGTDDDLLIHPGIDGIYGTEDDFIDLENGTNLRPGSDKGFGTLDDMLFNNGENTVPGDSDDRFSGYPNRIPEAEGNSGGTGNLSGNSSGGSSGSGSSGGSGGLGSSDHSGGSDSSGSGKPSYPDFGGRVSAGGLGPKPLPVSYTGLKGGTWTCTDEKKQLWTYSYDGFVPNNQWVYIFWEGTQKSGWYYFNSEGIMQTGWQLMENGKWYHLHTLSDGMLGRMDTGFYFESEDQSWYYLDPVLGSAVSGWQCIEEKWYCFNSAPKTQRWFWETDLGRWVYKVFTAKPYAAMYCNEKTPDGYTTDRNGVSCDYGIRQPGQ